MSDSVLEEVYINFSKRQVTLISDLGEAKDINWKWDDEGREGFAETEELIQRVVDSDDIPYTFSTYDCRSRYYRRRSM